MLPREVSTRTALRRCKGADGAGQPIRAAASVIWIFLLVVQVLTVQFSFGDLLDSLLDYDVIVFAESEAPDGPLKHGLRRLRASCVRGLHHLQTVPESPRPPPGTG